MSEENLKIADILFAYIKGTISECELEELTKWVEAAEEHRELFQQIVTSVSYQDKEAVYRRFDSYYDFDRLRGAIRFYYRSDKREFSRKSVCGKFLYYRVNQWQR